MPGRLEPRTLNFQTPLKYWLVKSEPSEWSWSDHWESPNRTARWDGVRNHQAKNNLIAMRVGDRAFFYHSVDEKRIVGVLEVVRESYADPADKTGKFVAVDFKAVEAVKQPMTLEQIKREPSLKDMVLVRNSRLSVQPVTPAQWKKICKMSGALS